MRAFFLLILLLSYSAHLQAKTPTASLLKIYKKALKEYRKSPKSYEKRMKLAKIAFDAGNFKQSYDLVLLILEDEKNDVEALTLYANILIEYGHEDKARRKLASIIAFYPQTKASKKAQRSIDMLDRLHNPFQSQHTYKAALGLDSNPSFSSNNPYLSNFLVTIACEGQGTSCNFNHRFKPLNPFIDTGLKADYVYDIGSLGGFFATYGWEVSAKNYIENIAAGDLSLGINYGIGFSTRHAGSFHLPISISENINKLSAKKDAETIKYFKFKIKPHYRYRFENTSLLSIGIEHEEQESNNEFQYKNSSTNYSSNSTFLFIDYQNKVGKKHPINFKIYVGSQDEGFNDQMDYNTTHIPYLQYDFWGFNTVFEYRKSEEKSYKSYMKFQKRIYFDYHKQDLPPPPLNDVRKDVSLELNTQVHFFNGRLSKSVLGYKIYANFTNYEPLDFIKHELYYSYYWLP